jgi:hypothetical protein
VGGFGTYSNTPTITYSRLTGAKFIRAPATPLRPETVFFSIEAALAADVILFAAVASINGLQNQEATLQGIAPADPDFHRVRALARKIQLSDGVRVVERKEAGEEMVSFLTLCQPSAQPEIQADIAEFRRLLKLDPTASEYKIIYGAAPDNDREIAVIVSEKPRSGEPGAAAKLTSTDRCRPHPTNWRRRYRSYAAPGGCSRDKSG